MFLKNARKWTLFNTSTIRMYLLRAFIFFFWQIRIWMFPTLGSCKENYTACENYTVRTLSKCDRLRTRKLQNASWWYVIILKFSRSKTTGGHTHTYILVKRQSLGFPEGKGNKQNKQLLPGHWFHALNRLRLRTNQCLLHYLSPFERSKLHATNNKMASQQSRVRVSDRKGCWECLPGSRDSLAGNAALAHMDPQYINLNFWGRSKVGRAGRTCLPSALPARIEIPNNRCIDGVATNADCRLKKRKLANLFVK